MARRHPPKNNQQRHFLTSPSQSDSSEFEATSIMVDQFPRPPRRRKRTRFFQGALDRVYTTAAHCRLSCRISRFSRCVVLLLVFIVATFITGRRPSSTAHFDTAAPQDDKANELLQALYDLELPSTEADLIALNEEFATLDPVFIIKWAHHVFLAPQHLRHDKTHHPFVQVTSFGPTGLVILNMLSTTQLLKDVPVVSMDTLHLFKESYAFYDTLRQHKDFSNIDLTITKPIGMDGRTFTTRDEFDKEYPWLWNRDPKRYTKYTKQDPLDKVLETGM